MRRLLAWLLAAALAALPVPALAARHRRVDPGTPTTIAPAATGTTPPAAPTTPPTRAGTAPPATATTPAPRRRPRRAPPTTAAVPPPATTATTPPPAAAQPAPVTTTAPAAARRRRARRPVALVVLRSLPRRVPRPDLGDRLLARLCSRPGRRRARHQPRRVRLGSAPVDFDGLDGWIRFGRPRPAMREISAQVILVTGRPSGLDARRRGRPRRTAARPSSSTAAGPSAWIARSTAAGRASTPTAAHSVADFPRSTASPACTATCSRRRGRPTQAYNQDAHRMLRELSEFSSSPCEHEADRRRRGGDARDARCPSARPRARHRAPRSPGSRPRPPRTSSRPRRRRSRRGL